MKIAVTCCCFAGVAAFAPAALAQDAGDVDDFAAEAPPARRAPLPDLWYKPVLGVAYVATPFAAYFGSEAADSYWPVAPALFLAPAAHWASGRGWRAGISLVMQPAAAYTGWMAAIAVSRPGCMDEAEADCGVEDATTGLLVGYLAWAVADLVLVPDLKPQPMDEGAAARRARRLAVQPLVTVTPRGQLVGGLTARF